jgi:hypothetical protein
MLVAALLVGIMFTLPTLGRAEGTYLGAYVPYNNVSDKLSSTERGAGWGVRLGQASQNRQFAIEWSLFETYHDVAGSSEHAQFGGGTMNLKLSVPLKQINLAPYLLAGIGAYRFEHNQVVDRGLGRQLGYGIAVYPATWFAITGGFTRTQVEFIEDTTIKTIDMGFMFFLD